MKKRILVVDDEPDILKTTQYVLESEGYDVMTARDGEEGLKKMNTAKPDLLLLDLRLPGKSGFQIAKEIKDDLLYKDIPIIVFSAMTDEASKYIAARNQAIAFIEKPIDIDKLSFQIKEALGNEK